MAAARSVDYLRLGLVTLASLIIASAWLVFPYLIQGQKLLTAAGNDARLTKAGRVSMYLTRHLVDSPDLELTATLATEEFFQYVDRAASIGSLRPDRNIIFIVSENIHAGQLDYELPDVTLHIGNREYAPEYAIGPNIAEHHRVSIYSIPKRSADGSVIDLTGAERLRLYVSNRYLGSERKLTFVGQWDAPFTLPEDLRSRADIGPAAVLALGAGLLSAVLTPCLLQLVVIFGSVIGPFSTIPGSDNINLSRVKPHIRRSLMQVALAFVLGFTALYTAAGALIGHIGYSAQLLFAEQSRTVAIVSGILVILMGIWIGVRGGRNFACRVSDERFMRLARRRDAVSSTLVSVGYALGCTACFGGAIVATLIVYVGAIGSAAIGASIMLVFSIGVAIPFLAAAWFVSHMNVLLDFLARNSHAISIISMLIVVAFGLILITDNFHAVSDAIYPYLGLN